MLGEYNLHVREFKFLQDEFILDMQLPIDILYFVQVISYKCEIFGHPLYISSKFLLYTRGLRELWYGTLHIQFFWGGFCWARLISSALEASSICVYSSASNLLLLLATVEPWYLDLFTWGGTWPSIFMCWSMSWDPGKCWYITSVFLRLNFIATVNYS